MSRQSSAIKIFKVSSKGLVDAIIYEDLSPKNFDDYNNLWKPELKKANIKARDLKSKGNEHFFAEDEEWDWNGKVKSIQHESLSYLHYAIECEDLTQGMMQLNLTQHRSKANAALEVVYVEYLSTAPWNRETIKNPPSFRAVGTVLIAQAIGASIDQGFKGRLGLHSLPMAHDWYVKLGFKNYGSDEDAKGLDYFELDEESAKKILEKLAKN